jgi:L-fuculose-phosphate aldolase
MTKKIWQLREEIHRIGQMIDDKGFIAANDGNISARVDKNLFLATPTGMRKSAIAPENLLLVNEKAEVVDGPAGLRTTTEFLMHLKVYELRPDVNAVVHAHPPTATGYALAHKSMAGMYLPEIIYFMKDPGYAPYGTPGTPELANAVAAIVREHDAFLMENHGAVGIAADLKMAWWHLERLEHLAKILVAGEILGGPKELSAQNAQKILDMV